eukprot:CAMPEP_0169220756 /NCGR_PEP_ID=MMETSP1016-20121227/20688_1 /TAXON_ID=342587 /ORGANISM="Karlodinium micrum, Strain CCMP2283" /LENGTH=79 /DNA_ID=CAMNT_0009298925 /DNA_START=148 /DNA_END=387 /DNA_ORIENTATION=-
MAWIIDAALDAPPFKRGCPLIGEFPALRDTALAITSSATDAILPTAFVNIAPTATSTSNLVSKLAPKKADATPMMSSSP